MGTKYEFKEEERKRKAEARRKNKDKRIERRLRVLELQAEGKSAKETAEASGYCKTYIHQLVAKYREHGLASLTGNHYGGNHRSMSKEEEAAILEAFKARAEKGELVEISEVDKAYRAAVDH